MNKKHEAEICPFCGSEYTEVNERTTDMGIDENQQEQMYLFEERTCTECHKGFTDCYVINYDGYFANGKNFNVDGAEYEV